VSNSYDGDPLDFSWKTPPWMGEGETVSGTSDDDLGEVTTVGNSDPRRETVSDIVRRAEPTGGYPAASVARLQRRLEQYYSVDATPETIQQALGAHTEWIDPTDDPDAKFAVLDVHEQAIIETVIEGGREVYERVDADSTKIDEVLASRAELIRTLAKGPTDSETETEIEHTAGSEPGTEDETNSETGSDPETEIESEETPAIQQLDAKSDYDELTAIQQRVVDELAHDPDRTNAAIADAVDCSDGYISLVRSNKSDIIERRRQAVAHVDDSVSTPQAAAGSATGTARTDTDSIETADGDLDTGPDADGTDDDDAPPSGGTPSGASVDDFREERETLLSMGVAVSDLAPKQCHILELAVRYRHCSLPEIADRANTSRSYARDVLRRYWDDHPARVSSRSDKSVRPDDINTMRQRALQGEPASQIADDFDFSKQSICRYLAGRYGPECDIQPLAYDNGTGAWVRQSDLASTDTGSGPKPDADPVPETDDGDDGRPDAEPAPEQSTPAAIDIETETESDRALSTQTTFVEREWEWERDHEFEAAARAIKATAQSAETKQAIDHLLGIWREDTETAAPATATEVSQ
jgi:hypothetical protein